MSLALLFHYLLFNMFRMLVHPFQELATYCGFISLCCIALVRCVLVLRCGLAGVLWCPYYRLQPVHPSSGACDLLWIYFMCCIALVRCVLVLRCGLAGVVYTHNVNLMFIGPCIILIVE